MGTRKLVPTQPGFTYFICLITALLHFILEKKQFEASRQRLLKALTSMDISKLESAMEDFEKLLTTEQKKVNESTLVEKAKREIALLTEWKSNYI